MAVVPAGGVPGGGATERALEALGPTGTPGAVAAVEGTAHGGGERKGRRFRDRVLRVWKKVSF